MELIPLKRLGGSIFVLQNDQADNFKNPYYEFYAQSEPVPSSAIATVPIKYAKRPLGQSPTSSRSLPSRASPTFSIMIQCCY